jgi:hypothetical protein
MIFPAPKAYRAEFDAMAEAERAEVLQIAEDYLKRLTADLATARRARKKQDQCAFVWTMASILRDVTVTEADKQPEEVK